MSIYQQYVQKIKLLMESGWFYGSKESELISDIMNHSGFAEFKSSIPDLGILKLESKTVISVQALHVIIQRALRAAGCSHENASIISMSLIEAEMQGIHEYGISRLSQYIQHIKTGRVSGYANPCVSHVNNNITLIDAQGGFAHPATQFGFKLIENRLDEQGMFLLGFSNSHHFGVAADHLIPYANRGCIALALSNAPASMSVGNSAWDLIGANPIAAVLPRNNTDPVVLDLGFSSLNDGDLSSYIEERMNLSEDIATDPRNAMKRKNIPWIDDKWILSGLIIQLFYILINSECFDINKQNIEHLIFVINPSLISGGEIYLKKIENMFKHIASEPASSMPGYDRFMNKKHTIENGITIPVRLLHQMIRDARYS